MKIEIHKFGDVLVSRPAGREAALAARSFLTPQHPGEAFELDFDGVLVLTPSWIDEFVQGLRSAFANPIVFLASQNASVVESLKHVG